MFKSQFPDCSMLMACNEINVGRRFVLAFLICPFFFPSLVSEVGKLSEMSKDGGNLTVPETDFEKTK